MIITTSAAATAQFTLLCPPTDDPVLTAGEVTTLLNNARRAYIWSAGVAYDMGVIVMPTVRNGRRYRLIAFDGSGIRSGATEPDWPAPNASGNDWPVWGNVQPSPVVGWWRNAIVTDGNITWQEDGEDYDSLWDIGRAVFNGWLKKAGKAICAVDLSSGQMKQAQSQIYQHCVDMAQRYAPAYVA